MKCQDIIRVQTGCHCRFSKFGGSKVSRTSTRHFATYNIFLNASQSVLSELTVLLFLTLWVQLNQVRLFCQPYTATRTATASSVPCLKSFKWGRQKSEMCRHSTSMS